VSKRSYRRLAALTGATLALTAAAPAMALGVNAGGNGTVTIDSDVSGLLPAAPTTLVMNSALFALGIADSAHDTALVDVLSLNAAAMKDVSDLTGHAGTLVGSGASAVHAVAVDAQSLIGAVNVPAITTNVATTVNGPLVGNVTGPLTGPIGPLSAVVTAPVNAVVNGGNLALPGLTPVTGLLTTLLSSSVSGNVSVLGSIMTTL
jgi:hypothetical protein